MNKRQRLLLSGAGLAALAGAGLFTFLMASRPTPPVLPTLADNSQQVASDRADRMVAEILKRPLFTQGREPPHPKIVKAEPPKLQGRLAGVVVQNNVREAVFTRPGAMPVSVKEGQVIDGWTASRIDADQVVLTSSFGQQIVKLTNGSAEEITPGRRPVKKTTPTKVTPPKPPQQKSQLITQAATAAVAGPR